MMPSAIFILRDSVRSAVAMRMVCSTRELSEKLLTLRSIFELNILGRNPGPRIILHHIILGDSPAVSHKKG